MSGEDLIFHKIPLTYPPTPEQKDRARKIVCGNAVDVTEADSLMRMLGLL